MLFRPLLAPALALLIALAAAPLQAQTPAAPEGAPLDIDHPDKLQGLKRVVIPSFNVHFVTQSRAGVPINGVQVLTGAPSNVTITLKGADPARFQALADALYDQTVQRLQAVGIEVVPLATLQAQPAFAEIVQKADPGPKAEDAAAGQGVFHAARGLPLYHMDEVSFIQKFEIKLFGGKKPEDTFLPLSSRLAAGFSHGFIAQAEQRLAQALDAAVLKVRLTVTAGTLDVATNFWTGQEISTRAAATMSPLVNRFAFILPDGGKARLALKQPVTSGEIGELANVTSTTSQAADVARNVLNVAMILGGARTNMGYGRSADYEWRVTPEVYEQGVSAQAAQLVAQLVTQVQALRP